jgi:hypothetical protein
MGSITMISQYWPMHPQPLPDESFTSWVLRASIANGTKFYTMCYLTSPKVPTLTGPLDQAMKKEAIALYAQKLNVPLNDAINTALISYEGILVDMKKDGCHMSGILHSGAQKYNELCFPLQFCPLCLSEGIPYYRKRWHVSFITVCTTHHVQLIDRCPSCQSQIAPTRNDLQKNRMPFDGDMTKCFRCQFDLKQAVARETCSEIVADCELYENIIDQGMVKLTSDKWIYSFLFFKGLKFLSQAILKKYKHNYPSLPYVELDAFPHDARYFVAEKLTRVFQNWPSRFIELCNTEFLTYKHLTYISKLSQTLPFWLESEFQQYAYRPNPKTSEQSVLSAINCMEKACLPINKASISKFMGYNDSGVVRRVFDKYQKQLTLKKKQGENQL